MTTPHAINVAIHVLAGGIGLILGFIELVRTKGDEAHRRIGRRFVGIAMVVTGTAAVGSALFRFLPLFAVLTVLVTYQAVGALRVARTRERGPALVDLWWTLAGLAAALALLPVLLRSTATSSTQPVVVWSSLGALGALLTYDFARWVFPRRWFARIWESEHVYKATSAVFGMLSAFVGNVVRWGQPWSQVVPSAVGLVVIAGFIYRINTRR